MKKWVLILFSTFLSDKMKSIKQRVNIIIGIISFGFIIYVLVFQAIQRNISAEIDEYGIEGTAKVIRIYTAAKARRYFEYVFIIDSDQYHGHEEYKDSRGLIAIGDSIKIQYLPDAPDRGSIVILNPDGSVVHCGHSVSN